MLPPTKGMTAPKKTTKVEQNYLLNNISDSDLTCKFSHLEISMMDQSILFRSTITSSKIYPSE